MATIKECNDFIDVIAPIAQRQAKLHDNKVFPSVCIAQACCESAYGTSPKMIRANAVFGIKVGKSRAHFGSAWKDKAYSTKTKECYDGKTYTEITDMFRAYDSLEESVQDYFDMLCTSSRYRHALNRSTPKECIEGIQKAPYATSPTYVNTIMSIIRKFNLDKYDTQKNPTLRKGSKGEYVCVLQRALNQNGYHLVEDGIFGTNTFNAVVSYQAERGLAKDGIVGKNTWNALGY